MRVAIVTESFPPDLTGVANCVAQVAGHLVRRGHQPLVIAPKPDPKLGWKDDPAASYPVVRIASVPMPGYKSFRLGMPCRALRAAIASHNPDIVHLASPFVLGAGGSAAAARLGLPVVAVYQTDMQAYARAYHTGAPGEWLARYWLRRIHGRADRTLAPSGSAVTALRVAGIDRVWLWGRGVDTARFDPGKRDAAFRREFAPDGEVIVGYVGRLAAEKRLDLLTEVAAVPGTRLVIVGDGPAGERSRQLLPGAIFLGPKRGDELARIYASLDVFVHPGPHETFGQTLQEAAASGVPVVAPAAGGPLDLVRDGVTGYLVLPCDTGALATAVAKLAADPGLRAEQGEQGRRGVLGRDWRSLGDELIGHYAAVLRLTGPALWPAEAVA